MSIASGNGKEKYISAYNNYFEFCWPNNFVYIKSTAFILGPIIIRNSRDSGGDAANLFGTFCPKEPGLGRLPNKHFCGPTAQQKFRSVATPELLAICALPQKQQNNGVHTSRLCDMAVSFLLDKVCQ